jgi:hypothetical protein
VKRASTAVTSPMLGRISDRATTSPSASSVLVSSPNRMVKS